MLEGPTIATGINSSEKETLELLMASLRPGDIVYDVGANVGLYTVFLGKIVGGTGQVLAFEPDSRNYRRLQENIGLNRLPNVHCFRKALADRTGTAELYIEKGDTCVSSLVRPLSTGNIEQQVVELVEGDGFRRAENLPVPHAIKIDVEGSEYAVIQGLRGTLAETLCRLVCCEIHPQLLPQGVKSERICDLLKSLGFTRVEVVLRGLVQHVLCRKR
jgi:FkbM family methyltransferase